MKGDFSRSTFRRGRHYSGVRMQQGRVQLDADWNENLDILRHRIETETIDVVGQCGVPVHHAAFEVVTDFANLSQEEQDWLADHDMKTLEAGDFYLTQGRAYVDGILVEIDHTLPFSRQPYVLPKGKGKIPDVGTYLLYLDIWERHITAIEDPHIREVALGGPDTATRTQIIWQAVLAKVASDGQTVTCADDLHPWPDPSKGRLRARTHPEDQPEDPCTVPPSAGYKRLENQLYRVEIHDLDPKTGNATFKWSRDNGSVAVAISEFAVDGAGAKIRTASLGRDDVLGLHENDWVEVLDDATELAGKPGTLARITKIDPGHILTLSASISGYDIDGHPKIRRWDSDGAQPVTVPATNDGYLKLEGGVEVKFEIDTFHPGDYWQIAARTIPGQYGEIEWPQEGGDPVALLPFGIVHHYCKLAVISGDPFKRAFDVEDCRHIFPPLTELPGAGNCCCSVTVGEGGDYPTLKAALDARPANVDQWRICILDGKLGLADTVAAANVKGVVISGCGGQTLVIGPQGKPVFTFTGAQGVQLENLWIEASSPSGAIIFKDSQNVVINDLVASNQIKPKGTPPPALMASAVGRTGTPAPLIVLDACRDVEIRDNDLFGLPAILADGNEIYIRRNRVFGGGIQIAPPSSAVQIEDNTILKGAGPGIRLGGGGKDATAFYTTNTANGTKGPNTSTTYARAVNFLSGIKLATISRNLIGAMQGSGIVTELNLLAIGKLSDVEMLVISDNQIVNCASAPDIDLGESTRVGGGIALIGVMGARIDHNFIAGNGSAGTPACGIFILDASDIDIDDNTIVENGASESGDKPDRYQAGIAAQFVFGNYLGIGSGSDGKLGYPALRVRGNEVVCPAGQALSVTAEGGVVVDGNSLASREILNQPDSPLDFGQKAGCVYILDMGVPVWLPNLAVLLQMMITGQVNLHLTGAQAADQALSGVPDGRVLFNNNQVTFNSAHVEEVTDLGPIDSGWYTRAWNAAAFSVLLTSLDDIVMDGNQLQATVPLYVQDGLQKYQAGQITVAQLYAYLVKFIHVGTVGSTVRATDNGLNERIYSNWVSYGSNGTALSLATGNEVTHAITVNAPKKAEANNLSLTS